MDCSASIGSANGLDGCDAGRADAVDRRDARSDGDPVLVYGAGSAQRLATTKLCAGQTQNITQHPKKGYVTIDIDHVCLPVYFDAEGHGVCSQFSHSITHLNDFRDPTPPAPH